MVGGQIIELLLLAFIGSVAGLVGGAVFLLKRDWAKTLGMVAVPFAAGVLISVSLLDLLPEAVHEIGESAFKVALIALLGAYFFEQFFVLLHHHEHEGESTHETSVPIVVLGDTIHNFIDGVAIGAAYAVDPYFGLIVAFATFLHETPHEIADFGILISAGWSRIRTFGVNTISALATFPGALFAYSLADSAHQATGVLLAVSAGLFLYLGASDFLPQVARGHKSKTPAWRNFLLLILGVAVIYLVTLFLHNDFH